jgi:hypothetical protein
VNLQQLHAPTRHNAIKHAALVQTNQTAADSNARSTLADKAGMGMAAGEGLQLSPPCMVWSGLYLNRQIFVVTSKGDGCPPPQPQLC